jgi:hypothetical protein
VEALSRELLAVAALAVDPAASTLMSARLLEATLWAVARWADSYLLPQHNQGTSVELHGWGTRLGVLCPALTPPHAREGLRVRPPAALRLLRCSPFHLRFALPSPRRQPAPVAAAVHRARRPATRVRGRRRR